MNNYKFWISLVMISLLFVGVTFLHVWKITWNEMPDVYKLDELLTSNYEIAPGESLAWETSLLSAKVKSISIPMKIATDSAALVEIGQINGIKTSSQVPTLDGAAMILYIIELPQNVNWDQSAKLNIQISNARTNSQAIGVQLNQYQLAGFRAFDARLLKNDELMENKSLQLAIGYADVDEPINLREYTNPWEVVQVAWKRNSNWKVNSLIVGGLLIGAGVIGHELYKKAKITQADVVMSVVIIGLMIWAF